MSLPDCDFHRIPNWKISHWSAVGYMPQHNIRGIHVEIRRIFVIIAGTGDWFPVNSSVLPKPISVWMIGAVSLLARPAVTGCTMSPDIVFMDRCNKSPTTPCRHQVTVCLKYASLQKNKVAWQQIYLSKLSTNDDDLRLQAYNVWPPHRPIGRSWFTALRFYTVNSNQPTSVCRRLVEQLWCCGYFRCDISLHYFRYFSALLFTFMYIWPRLVYGNGNLLLWDAMRWNSEVRKSHGIAWDNCCKDFIKL